MPLSVAVSPLSDVLHMYGQSDPRSAYSLSGHVSIAVRSPYSLFEARRPARLLLESVSLVFEGQSEIFTPSTGYSSLRLCSVTRELIQHEPIELSNEGHEDSDEPCVWNIIFDLPIPGWLPESTTMGIEDIGIRYTLYATARFTDLDEEQHTAWSFAALCAPFRSRIRTAEGSKTVNLHRFIKAPRAEIIEMPRVNYLVTSTVSSKGELSKNRIPPEVLCKVQVLASVPEYVNIEDNELPIMLRMRTKDLCEEECKKIQVTDVSIDIVQQEKWRYRPSASYLARYSLPPKEMQPPNLPLREPHPVSSIYDVGLFVPSGYSEAVCRTFSLLPAHEGGKYKLEDNNYVFANDAKPEAVPTWYTMDSTIPFAQRSPARADPECIEWAGMPDIRPTSSSPLFSVMHDVVIALACTYDLENGEVAKENLSFRIPLTFGRVAPRLSQQDSITGIATATRAEEPTSFTLPAYSQLYDVNGERKVDYSIPLPLYTPRSGTLVDTSDSDTSSSASATAAVGSGLLPLAIDSSTNVYHGHNAPIGQKHAVHARSLSFDADEEDRNVLGSPAQ